MGDDDGIAHAGVLAVRAAAATGIAGLVAALTFNFGPAVGVVGIAVASALSFRWISQAMESISGR